MAKRIYVKLYPWASRYYPVIARFSLGSVDYSLVFETEEQAKSYFRQRFYPVTIVFESAKGGRKDENRNV